MKPTVCHPPQKGTFISAGPERALDHYRRSLRRRVATLGPDAPGTAAIEHLIATVLVDLGRQGEAMPYAKSAMQYYRHTVANDHPFRLRSEALWEELLEPELIVGPLSVDEAAMVLRAAEVEEAKAAKIPPIPASARKASRIENLAAPLALFGDGSELSVHGMGIDAPELASVRKRVTRRPLAHPR